MPTIQFVLGSARLAGIVECGGLTPLSGSGIRGGAQFPTEALSAVHVSEDSFVGDLALSLESGDRSPQSKFAADFVAPPPKSVSRSQLDHCS